MSEINGLLDAIASTEYETEDVIMHFGDVRGRLFDELEELYICGRGNPYQRKKMREYLYINKQVDREYLNEWD